MSLDPWDDYPNNPVDEKELKNCPACRRILYDGQDFCDKFCEEEFSKNL